MLLLFLFLFRKMFAWVDLFEFAAASRSLFMPKSSLNYDLVHWECHRSDFAQPRYNRYSIVIKYDKKILKYSFLDPRQWPKGSYKLGPIRPSILPFVLPFAFFGIMSLFFSKLWSVLETRMKLCLTEPDFLEKKVFAQKLGKWTKNGPKTGFV